MVNPQDFFIEHNGKFLDFDGAFGAQCTDVIKAYFSECLGIPPVKGNAIDYWTTPPKGFTKVTDPRYWDLVVFDYKPVGHIAIVNWATATEINCFSQNDPLKAPCGFKTYPRDKHILGYLRWPNFPPETPRPTSQSPHSDTSSGKFIMNYTSINVEPTLLEQGRQLLKSFSNNQVDCTFEYQQLPQIVPLNKQVFTIDEQIQFLKNFPIKTRFGFVKYFSTMSGFQMTTAEIPQTPNIVTFATENNQDPLYVCYEMVNALYAQALSKGLQVQNDDIFTPSETFVKQKVENLLPYLSQLS